MKVKRYVVDSMPDALQKIRSDLGKDAVILNTKEVRSGGFLGLFGKKKIEVIAATDSAAASAPKVSSGGRVNRADTQSIHAAVAAAVENTRPPADPEATMPFVPDVIPPKSERPIPGSAYTGPLKPQPQSQPQKEEKILDEMRQMKEMMVRLAAKGGADLTVRHPFLQEAERHLLDQETDPALVEEIIGSVEQSLDPDQEDYERAALQAIEDRLLSILTGEGRKQISPETQVVHFVGPTGVGKTTTIAKLAAEQVLKNGRKVGFITSDTYRIAAVEQLKTYATILNIPLEVVFSPLDLKKAFEKLQDRDIIFMDTAGRNFRNEMYVSELNALLQSKGSSETFLVLSLTTKYKDMRVIADNFMKFKVDKVLFTKMDETASYGAIANIVHDFSLNLSYVTNGQNVPDDIIEADERLITRHITEGLKHE